MLQRVETSHGGNTGMYSRVKLNLRTPFRQSRPVHASLVVIHRKLDELHTMSAELVLAMMLSSAV